MRPVSIGAIGGFILSLATLSHGTPPTTAPAAIAHFDFRNGVHDASEGQAKAVLKNAEVAGGRLILNGQYGDEAMTGSGYAAKFKVPWLDYNRFTVAWRFKADDFDSHDQYHHWNLLTGGEKWRWLSFRRLPSGVVRLDLNNGDKDDVGLELKGTNIRASVWTTVVCSFDLATRTVLVAVDGVVTPAVRLPEDFKLRVMDAPRDVDRLFTFTNYSNAMTFSGEVSELVVFPYAMSESQIKEQKFSSAD